MAELATRRGRVTGRFQRPRTWPAVLALILAAGCRSATAQSQPGACAAPPAWRQPGAKPGQPDAELAACLKEKAWGARAVRVPVASKTAGLIAQCEVDVDQFEGRMVFGCAGGSQEEREAAEQQVQQQAAAAIEATQGCGGG
jgi:hypothetical protein